jgi:hypothetical protein
MKKIFQILLIIVLAGYVTSCEKFLDINDDPNNPADAKVSDLMPAGQLGVMFGLSNMINRIGEDAVQHLVVQRFDGWAVESSDLNNAWRNALYAGGLKDFEVIIEKGTTGENYHFVGVAKLMKAYAFSIMVDIWDDIPYSQSLNDDFPQPQFDDAAAIYDALFALIDEGIADLDRANEIDLTPYDLFYGGNTASWKRMGNTLKLKMYNQIRLVDHNRARSGIEALVAAEAASPRTVLITSMSQDFNFSYVNNASPENRHPGFQNDYMVKGEAHISNYFYNMMFGNSDPRLPYYFYMQSGQYEGRNYGDPEPIGNDNDSRTVQGIYPVGGRYEDGSALPVSGSRGSGDGVFRMLTNKMRLFIEAEAALTMGASVSDVADSLFKYAMLASFQEINSLDAPSPEESDVNAYVNARLAEYVAAATTEEKLEILMTEKWISQFGNGIESFNDYRRTGYPDIPDPIETNEVELRRYPYPRVELETNPSAPSQPEKNVPVFWDNN